MKTVFIYTLADPRTGLVRYVGASSNPFKRIYGHLYEFSKGEKYAWITELKDLNLWPLVDLIDEVPLRDCQEVETEYIRVFKAIGVPLLNVQTKTQPIRRHFRRKKKQKQPKKSKYFLFHTKYRALVLIQRAENKRLAAQKII